MKRMKLATASDSRGSVLGAQKSEPAALSPEQNLRNNPFTGLLSIEEEMIMIILQHPSEAAGRLLADVEWLDSRCGKVWELARTKLAAEALQISEVLAALPEEIREWLTPLVLQERQYPHPHVVLEEL